MKYKDLSTHDKKLGVLYDTTTKTNNEYNKI